MTVHHISRTAARVPGLLALAAVLGAAPAFAAAHRARLSEDLTDHLAAGSPAINVIVDGDAATVNALAARYNLVVAKRLVSGAVLRVTAGQLDALRQDEGVDHLSGDVPIRSIADVTAEAIGADQVWAGSDAVPALSGAGVTVAVIDSGIDAAHSAFLGGRVLATKDFTGGDGVDRFGHGTHVAATIAGGNGRTADTRAYRGIAAGAYLLNLRVLGDDGSGVASDVIEAIDWTVAHRAQFNVRVINLSLGAPVLQPYRDDPLCEAVERAVRAGITVVVAAGNMGRSADGGSVYGGITSPGNSPHALTVGAIDTHGTADRSDDTVAAYSSKGPTRFDLIVKPDLAAPGSHIVSAEAAGSYLAQTYPARHVAGTGADAYMQLSGTSMAAGVVSGAVALLLEARSDLSPRDARLVLEATSTFLPGAGLLGAGAGEIDLQQAANLVSGRVNAWRLDSRSHRRVQGSNAPIADRDIGGLTIFWGTTIYWSTTIYWGTTIYWETELADADTQGAANSYPSASTIYWGTAVTDPQTMSTMTGDTIFWDSAVPD